jgi:hypothetical protein
MNPIIDADILSHLCRNTGLSNGIIITNVKLHNSSYNDDFIVRIRNSQLLDPTVLDDIQAYRDSNSERAYFLEGYIRHSDSVLELIWGS